MDFRGRRRTRESGVTPELHKVSDRTGSHRDESDVPEAQDSEHSCSTRLSQEQRMRQQMERAQQAAAAAAQQAAREAQQAAREAQHAQHAQQAQQAQQAGREAILIIRHPTELHCQILD